MTDSFRQKVEEILGWIAYGRLQPDKEGNPEQVQVSVEIATDAIMLLVKGIVPKLIPTTLDDVVVSYDTHDQDIYRGGFNDCREQILTKLEEGSQ